MSEVLVPVKEGGVYAFLEKSDLLLGLFMGSKGSALRLLCVDQRERNMPPRRILGLCGSLPPTMSREAAVPRLEILLRQILDLSRSIDLVTLWEALNDQTELLEFQDLASHWFGAKPSGEQIVAMTWAVLQESLRFKVKGTQIKVQEREQVEQKLEQQAQQAERERILHESQDWIAGGPRPDSAAELVAQLKEVALFGKEAPRLAEVRDLLHKLGPAGHEARVAFDALVTVGIWDKDENLELYREGIPVEPDPEVLRATSLAVLRTWDRSERVDWSGRDTFSVDPASTLDVDDAITCWVDEDKLRVAVHITDVTEFVEAEKELDLDARMRGLSIYLPTKVIPMLPVLLSEQAASLLPGQKRPAITLCFVANPDGSLEERRFELTEVCVTRKLSYADVDRMLPQDPLLQRLLQFCQAQRRKRIEAGAVLLPLPEVSLSVDVENRVKVHLEKDSASHQMVSELMICFNASVAEYCHHHEVPALYRGQPEPRRRIAGAQTGLYQCLLQRRQMLRSTTALAPVRHSGLGLEAYTMATSPLRRYLDLCMQWQIRGRILGKSPLFDAKRLEELLPYLGLAQRRVQKIERATHRYWMCRWLEQLPAPEAQAIWLEPMSGRDRAALLPFLTEVDVDLKGVKPPKKGSLVELEVARVQAREAELHLVFRGLAKKLDPAAEPLAELLAGP